MGCEIKDIDLCVSLPSGGVRFAEWMRDNGYAMKGVTVYPNYGTAMLRLKAFPDVDLQFVQTRKEKYIDHSCRNPETAFGSIEDDCMRRDLTINALYCNVSTGEIVDITGKGVMEIKGIGPGPQVKECLDYLLKLAFANPLRDKEETIKHLKGYRL